MQLSRNRGVVFCSETNAVDSSSEPVQDEVDSVMSKSSPAMVVSSFSEAGIEVVRSIENAENVILQSVSALDEGGFFGKETYASLITSALDASSTEGPVSDEPAQLLIAPEKPSSAMVSSLMVS
uniref:Uncharacterized protein n=2 Tax=Physcomitrium patens TaxID=3218 RepID=A0A2K1KMN7_PHYPA|nr:hypothetical protein PHYPA_005935 [Physcomitrium patens]